MNYDISKMSLGICQNCMMRGMLTQKAMIRPIDVSSVDGDVDAPLPLMWACVTCLETPAGMRSGNLGHRRLAKEEYLVK
jgi:hypothetical protein